MREMLMQGVELMVAGMSIVFIFLALLVFAVTGLRKAVEKFLPEPVIEPKYPQNRSVTVQADVVTAITLAVRQYRDKHLS